VITPVIAILLAFIFLILKIDKCKKMIGLLCSCAIFLSCLLSFIYFDNYFKAYEIYDERVEIVGEVTDVSKSSSYTTRLLVKVEKINGKGGKIAAIPVLDYVDNMTTSLSLPEQKLHTYSKRLTQVGKQKFHEIKIISTVDAEKIAAANKEMFLFYEGANKINSPVYAKRPMQRVYYVGVADGMVYFMQHFTHHKHLIREKEITNIDFDISLSANDFEADWEIHGDYIIFYDEYAAPALNKLYVSKLQINKDKTYYYNSLIVRSIDWILFPPNAKLISIGFFIIAAASTATLVFIRRKR
jgi:hypothetical protein